MTRIMYNDRTILLLNLLNPINTKVLSKMSQDLPLDFSAFYIKNRNKRKMLYTNNINNFI